LARRAFPVQARPVCIKSLTRAFCTRFGLVFVHLGGKRHEKILFLLPALPKSAGAGGANKRSLFVQPAQSEKRDPLPPEARDAKTAARRSGSPSYEKHQS